jgi:hypothetical protein
MSLDHGGTFVMTWSSNGARVEVHGKGKVTFTDDDIDVKSLEPGGYFRIAKGGSWLGSWFGSSASSFEARSTAGGGIERVYRIDGRVVSADQGRKWTASVLPEMIREGAIGAAGRVARLLAKGGPDGVLAEISRIRSGFAKRVYFTELLAQARPDDTLLVRSLIQGGREISSDFELGQLLKSAAARYELNDTTANAYADAARHIHSDFELHHALAAALKQTALSGAAARPLVTAAVPGNGGGIDSDFELAQLLGAIPPSRIDGIGPVYFEAIRSIDSSFERARVLTPIVARQDASAPTIDSALDATAAVSGDFERANVLVAYVKAHAPAIAQVRTFFAAVKRIGSDFERRRVLASLAVQTNLPDPVIIGIADATTTMGSDFERAEVLMPLGRTQRLDGAARDAVLKAAEQIGSDHERGRVLSVLLRRGSLSSMTR